MNIRFGIFDDHPMTSKGLANFIVESDAKLNMVFNAQTKNQLLAELKSNPVDILILDIIAPDVDGLELFENIHKKYPDIGLIAYSSLNSAILIENLLAIGVLGFVNKKQAPEQMLLAIQRVNNGEIYLPDEYKNLSKGIREFQNTRLSKRELEILKLIAKEMTSHEIAEMLFISLSTVENHRQNLFRKLEVKNIAGLIMMATRMGYIS